MNPKVWAGSEASVVLAEWEEWAVLEASVVLAEWVELDPGLSHA